ncbi:hypothetical protein V8F33_012472 [Rhypophila sp. PSN 637]
MTTSPLVRVGLERLTPEILHLIIDALVTPEYVEGEKGDPECLHALQNLRLTSRLLNAIASEKMFPSITVGCRTSSVDRFCAVAAHPFLSQGVRVVKVSLDDYSARLRSTSNFRRWVNMCVHRLSSMIESRSPLGIFYGACTSGISRAELEEPVSILESWTKVRDDLPLVDTRCKYVKGLQNAQKIYAREAAESFRRDLPQVLAQAMTRLPRARSLHFVETSMPADRWTIYPNSPWKSYYKPMTDPVPTRCYYYTGVSPARRQPCSYRLLHRLPIMLQALRPGVRLEHMVVRLALPPVLRKTQAEDLTAALSCSKLRTLTFTVDNHPGLPNLKRIRLHRVDIHENQLKSFLANTPATLDEFVLDQVKIAEVPDKSLGRYRRVGSWKNTLDLIRQCKTFNKTVPGPDVGTRGFRLTHVQPSALGDAPEATSLNFGDMSDAFGRIFYEMGMSYVWSFLDPDSNVLSKAEQFVNRCGEHKDTNPVRAILKRKAAGEWEDLNDKSKLIYDRHGELSDTCNYDWFPLYTVHL